MAERETESFLKRLEERLSRVAAWLRQRGGDEGGARDRHARLEAVRHELAQARRAVADTTHEDLARIRSALEDLRGDYDVPQQHTALHRAELEALRKHLHTTARLLHDRADLDNPSWVQANEEYERSWADLEHAFEGEGHAASP
ncbi:hypothetical protein [Anaeromyxobacter oryzae]|uniref:Uncharacterized protein n=1 Tax=Anaeromyxobacter oryzae TaxID=2918170 RepID=A0ABM7WRP2_9BACT|nr:hypothetical protein [Anaeromyxobacter oryzae]BDG02147.1 hypothetical protein AMOR_11430 [Anaeromyxobacter oryzae]